MNLRCPGLSRGERVRAAAVGHRRVRRNAWIDCRDRAWIQHWICRAVSEGDISVVVFIDEDHKAFVVVGDCTRYDPTELCQRIQRGQIGQDPGSNVKEARSAGI